MSKWPAQTRADHRRFCANEGWQIVRDTTGRRARHHVTLELELSDGRMLRTRISHPIGPDTYSASLWQHILRDQLQVTAGEFWACVEEGIAPRRGAATTHAVAKPLPLSLVRALLATGVSPAQLEGVSEVEARALLKRR